MKLIASLIAPSIASALFLANVSFASFVAQDDPAPPSDMQSTPSADAAGEDAELANLPAPMQAQVKQMLAKLLTVTDPAKLQQALTAMEAQSAQLPAEAKPMFDYLTKKIQDRITQLEAGAGTASAAPAAGEATSATTDAAGETAAAPSVKSDTPAEAQKAMTDFLYGVLAGRKELALTNAKFLLASGVTDQQLAQMIDDAGIQDRLSHAVSAAKGMGEVADLAAQIEIRVMSGRLELSRDQARIDAAVVQLGGTMRQQTMGRATLVSAGSYAVPALFKVLFDARNPQLELRASQTLIDIGRAAVLPLCEVLVTASAQEQIAICNMLTAMNSKTAAPWLAKAMRLASSSDVRKACDTALRALKMESIPETTLWSNLARDYFVSRDKLTPYPEDKMQILWSVGAGGAILPKRVATALYGDLMAMQCAQEAMRLDANGAEAFSIYLAAGLRAELGGGEINVDSHSIKSIALAAGAAQSERVLRLARQVNDPNLTMVAIGILSKTASESMLVDSKAGSPILGCLTNPSRSIRTAAALAIAHAQPRKAFQGSERVVPILGAAIQQGGLPRAIVIASDETQRRDLEGRLSQINCVLLSSDASASVVLQTLTGRGAPDLIIANGGADEMKAAINVLRSNSAFSATPILLVIPESDEVRIDRAIRQDPSIVIWFQGRSEEQFQEASKQLISRTIGIMSVEDSAALRLEALAALRMIGDIQTSPLKVADAERDLIDAVATTTDATQILVARVLAVTPTVAAQRALIDAALSATDDQQIALLQSLAESGRLQGNKAEERQLDRMRQALTDAKGANADALAQAYGAMNVGCAQVLKLILQ